ncbi:hypothetical protein FACS189421_00930 [Bacteroidia bacterium]|nr:hypothetical protein FACS189421_00930 [Bacteroidia bacterium]GHT46205.1 hypothetical protein FACS189440_03740 [Bacteroidia bacterium]
MKLNWFGGEPLLYFYEVVYPLSKYAKELCEENAIPFIATITTNGFCIDEKMIEKIKEIDLSEFQITLDGHRERHNKIRNNNGEASYDKIIQNINSLCRNIQKITVTLRINYDNQTLKKQQAESILNDIDLENRKKIHIDLQRVWQTTEHRNNAEDGIFALISTAKSAGYKKVSCSGGLNAGQFYNCYVSKYHYVGVNYDGQLYSKSTFDNPTCLKCAYLPLYWGPCPQKMVELKESGIDHYCVLSYTERSMKERIIDLYESSIKAMKQNVIT